MARTSQAAVAASEAADPAHEAFVAEAEPTSVPIAYKQGRHPTTAAPTTVASSDNKDAADVAKSKPKGKKSAASKAATLCTPSNTNDLPSAPNNSEPPTPKQAQQVQQTPKCDLHANCPCNKHPGQPYQPCAKWSSAKVQAAKAELHAIQAHEQEIEAHRVELYAQLEMEDEAEEIAEHENVVKTLADI